MTRNLSDHFLVLELVHKRCVMWIILDRKATVESSKSSNIITIHTLFERKYCLLNTKQAVCMSAICPKTAADRLDGRLKYHFLYSRNPCQNELSRIRDLWRSFSGAWINKRGIMSKYSSRFIAAISKLSFF